MKDIQNLRDDRRINIRKVGVKTISYPLTVLDKERRLQQTVATVNMYVNLPHCFKGTHMSRFIEVLNRFHGEINLRNFHLILEEVKQRLDAEAAHMEIVFPYFLQTDPVSGSIGSERYECRMHGFLEEEKDLILEVNVPIIVAGDQQSYGGLPKSMGHWGNVSVSVRFGRFLWIEDLICMVEEALMFYKGAPDSVESACRKVGTVLANHPAISWFKVIVENFSAGYSIFATVDGP